MIRIGVIGYGYWGPNLVRNFSDMDDAEIVAVCDLRPGRLESVQNRYPTIQITQDYNELLTNPDIDAIVIATPVKTHFDLAWKALQYDKHIFVEKPLTDHSDNAIRIIDEAEKRQKILMVDHTFVYTGAVKKIKQIIKEGELGELYYYDSVRVNLGLFQHDVNVLWDLAVHDLAIIDYLFDFKPNAVSATGTSHVPGQPEDMAYLTCFFDNNFVAHLHVNWLAPVKVRRTLIGGDRKMIVYDDLEPSEKVKLYDRGITLNETDEGLYQTVAGYRTGDMWAPQLDLTEALREEARHFVRCISENKRPITDGLAGLGVIKILEAANKSMAKHGSPVALD
jgi:predicted dehydrogenase